MRAMLISLFSLLFLFQIPISAEDVPLLNPLKTAAILRVRGDVKIQADANSKPAPAVAGGTIQGENILSTGQTSHMNNDEVTVRLLNDQGELSPPTRVPRVVKTDAEWKKILTEEQFRITRVKGTERAFCGAFFDHHKKGVYACVCCGLPLFSSGDKFDSRTGWPSFFQPVAKENIVEKKDISFGMVRTEILCVRCGAHLGHVFEDGPPPTGLRYCLNSAAMKFIERPAPKNK